MKLGLIREFCPRVVPNSADMMNQVPHELQLKAYQQTVDDLRDELQHLVKGECNAIRG